MTQSGSQKELYDRIIKAADYINRNSRSGAANYIIISRIVSDIC